jgi:polar amino acid transport system substrate-binding protein
LLAKDSALTACVSAAVDAITADGTLAAITEKWLATETGSAVLKP